MYLDSSRVSCGVLELYDIGNDPREKDLVSCLNNDACGAIIIASLTTQQTKAIKLLKKHGFKQTSRARTNPNSGNKIVLLFKNIDLRKARKISGEDGWY